MKTLIWRLPWQQIASFYTRCILVYYYVTTDVSATSRNGLMVTQGLKSGCIIQCSQTTWGRCSLLRCWRYAHSQVHKISLFMLNLVRACLDIEWFHEKGIYPEQNRVFHIIPNDKDSLSQTFLTYCFSAQIVIWKQFNTFHQFRKHLCCKNQNAIKIVFPFEMSLFFIIYEEMSNCRILSTAIVCSLSNHKEEIATNLPYIFCATGQLTDSGLRYVFSLHNNLANINMFLISPPGDKRRRLRDCRRPSGGNGQLSWSGLWALLQIAYHDRLV